MFKLLITIFFSQVIFASSFGVDLKVHGDSSDSYNFDNNTLVRQKNEDSTGFMLSAQYNLTLGPLFFIGAGYASENYKFIKLEKKNKSCSEQSCNYWNGINRYYFLETGIKLLSKNNYFLGFSATFGIGELNFKNTKSNNRTTKETKNYSLSSFVGYSTSFSSIRSEVDLYFGVIVTKTTLSKFKYEEESFNSKDFKERAHFLVGFTFR